MLESRTKVATYGPCIYSSSDSVVGPSENIIFMDRFARIRFFRLSPPDRTCFIGVFTVKLSNRHQENADSIKNLCALSTKVKWLLWFKISLALSVNWLEIIKYLSDKCWRIDWPVKIRSSSFRSFHYCKSNQYTFNHLQMTQLLKVLL